MEYPARGHDWYLKPDTKIQPVFCRWPAWPHLVAPAQAAMNIAYRYLPSLQSFAANPSIHLRAAADPAMFGGPFVALAESDLPQVASLMEQTRLQCAAMLDFAQQFRKLDLALQREAKGFRLDEFYRALPSVLAGRVELLYDLNNHPIVKVFEPLLYEEEFGARSCWELCLHRLPDAQRTFFMSTPLLDDPARTFLNLPLQDERIDMLTAMRTQPGSLTDLVQRLNLEEPAAIRFAELFTRQPPQRCTPRYGGDGVRVRYFGHACVLLETREATILFDPVTAWARDSEATLTFSDLPDFIDCIVLTHCHQDHCHPETLLQLRHRVGTVVVPANDAGNLTDPSMKLILRQLGYHDVRVVSAFDTVQIGDCELTSLPFVGEHAGMNVNSKHSILAKAREQKFLFLVDSDLVDRELCVRLARRIGRVDALFVGMECHGAPLTWLYGPLLSKPITRRDDESRRLSGSDCERAWSAVAAFGCTAAYVYAMGQESWLRGLMGLQYQPGCVQLVQSDQFVERCRQHGIRAQRLSGCTEMLFPRTDQLSA